ncbi:hypothetical protein BaRGS_00003006, partial [Batillaria attramentaria]
MRLTGMRLCGTSLTVMRLARKNPYNLPVVSALTDPNASWLQYHSTNKVAGTAHTHFPFWKRRDALRCPIRQIFEQLLFRAVPFLQK